MLYKYPAYNDANGVLRPILAEDLAELRALNANVMLPSCWCLAAFTGNYSKAPNLWVWILGKCLLVPIQELMSQGALRNHLHTPAPVGTNMVTSPAASISSSSSLLHALDERFLGSSKRKLIVQPNGSSKKSQVLVPDSDTDFSPPTHLFLPQKKQLDTMFKAAFLQKAPGSLCGTSTMEEFFQGMATFPTPSLPALEQAYMSGSGISLQEFQYLTNYCLECSKLFRRLAHNKHICFKVSQTQTHRKHIPKAEKGKGKFIMQL
ncbi:hypothetical protein IW261DRAFT_1419595 [Armillaria novae-zelandiae]|uniref:Uncharacterized protein n=1 Tax=Armillaria novae-zelandiae TaxID=153914 RepID=A0AA39U7X5_9AGAR|nr:hypothetical protein IW261DRAFT_1419595 [Armillaria novae-zelandiae]